MYVCDAHVCMCVWCMCVCMCVHMCVWLCVFVSTYVCVYMHMYTCMQVCGYVYVCAALVKNCVQNLSASAMQTCACV